MKIRIRSTGLESSEISYRGELLFHVIHQLGEPLVLRLQVSVFLLQLLVALTRLTQGRDGLGAEVRGQRSEVRGQGRAGQVRSGRQWSGHVRCQGGVGNRLRKGRLHSPLRTIQRPHEPPSSV